MRHRVLWILTILMVTMASELRPAPGEPLGSPVFLEELRNQHRSPQKAKRATAFPQSRQSKNRPAVMEPERQQKAGRPPSSRPRVLSACPPCNGDEREVVDLINPAANERRRRQQDCIVNRYALLVEISSDARCFCLICFARSDTQVDFLSIRDSYLMSACRPGSHPTATRFALGYRLTTFLPPIAFSA